MSDRLFEGQVACLVRVQNRDEACTLYTLKTAPSQQPFFAMPLDFLCGVWIRVV
jgi:hypothetical protein